MIDNKILVHMRAPVFSRAGYGSHAREIIDFLLSDDRLLVCLENINWGNTGYIHNSDVDEAKLKRYYHCRANFDRFNGKAPYDISVQVTIPNEFKRTAQLNIGVTAGIETDRVSREWIQKCNEMDLLVVPSQHSARVLNGTVYQIEDKKTGQKTDERVQKPTFVIPQYFHQPETLPDLKIDFETEKNLLFVGLWGGKGGYWEDRKNVSGLVKTFYETFKENSRVGLILKTSIVNNSELDRQETERRLKEIKDNFKGAKCKVYLVHADLTDDEMSALYSHPKVTGFVSLSAGEGFGRPLLEAASCGKPILATNWSGHLDFLREKHGFIPIDYSMVEIPECMVWPGVLEKGSKWARPNEADAQKRMRKFLNGSSVIKKQAQENVAWLKENFSKEAIEEKWKNLFNSFIRNEGEDLDEAPKKPRQFTEAVDKLRGMVEPSENQRALYIMPQSAGDCLISTAVIDSLLSFRHLGGCDFYVATSPQFADIFSELAEKRNVKVIEYCPEMMSAELTREVWDFVYNPGVNVQYNFSNWLLGNGDYSVRLLEEFAKNCNLSPREITNYKVKLEPCDLPKRAYVVIAPGGIKSAKQYKYWPDVISNIKEMVPDIDVVQIGLPNEELLPGCLDYRGKTYAQSFFIVKNAYAALAVDTFGAHIAGAMGTPHVVLYGSTHSSTCCPVLLKSNKVPQITIESTECQPKCYKDVCCKMREGKNCLSYIEPSSVCTAFETLVRQIEENGSEGER